MHPIEKYFRDHDSSMSWLSIFSFVLVLNIEYREQIHFSKLIQYFFDAEIHICIERVILFLLQK